MRVRYPARAGEFYPADAEALRRTVRSLLPEADAGLPPKGLVAPHAGYAYSGPTAGAAFRLLRNGSSAIRRVVMLGPAHFVPCRIALSSAEAFETPLGTVPVDRAALDLLRRLPQVEENDVPHAPEHSLETHLPFLQETLTEFRIVPLVIGRASPDEVAETLDALWDGPETLILVSTDLSHFLDYDSARELDSQTRRAVERLEPEAIREDQACGRVPLCGLLVAARRRGMEVETLDLRSSGDAGGPRERVVGYGAWAFRQAH